MKLQNIEALSELKKRVKQQKALFLEVANIDENDHSIETLIHEAGRLLEEKWYYLGEKAILISCGSIKFTTENYGETEWTVSAEKVVKGDVNILIEVIYFDASVFEDNEGLLVDDQTLVDSLTIQICSKVENILNRIEIEEKQQLLDKAYKLARIGTWEYDLLNDKLTWSTVTKHVHGFDKDYEPDIESTINLFKEGYDRRYFEKVVHDALELHKPFDVELKIISGMGDERWIRATGEPEFRDGVCVRFYGISQNVTDRRQAEESLELNEKRFRALIQDGSDILAILDEEANYLYVSPASEKILGTPPEHYIAKNASEFVHKDDWSRIFGQLTNLGLKESVEIKPFRFLNSKGEWRWIETKITNLTDDPAVQGYVANSRDITEKKKHQELILNSLSEKETLLAEIHHRVKNNLAVITGLLQLHISEEENEESLGRLYDSVSRIYTISSIHEQLYQSESFAKLDFTDNIRLLISNIMDTFKSDIPIEIEYKCESVELGINDALPCSLIINEIITNIFKHAFKGKERGRIVIYLSQKENKEIELVIFDNGRGLPENFKVKGNTSLGLTLIDVLSGQLNAEYKYEASANGTSFVLSFEANKLKLPNNI
jgi:PAS domain S-box-containing protein